jgi:BON domain-containing protein
VRNDDRLSAGSVILWGALGLGTGLTAGIALTALVGGVNAARVRRAATRLQQPRAPGPDSSAAHARAARAALAGEPALRGLTLDATVVSRGTVELRGWVPDRAARTLAARTVHNLPGIGTVINSILVRGEDDRAYSTGAPSDLPA